MLRRTQAVIRPNVEMLLQKLAFFYAPAYCKAASGAPPPTPVAIGPKRPAAYPTTREAVTVLLAVRGRDSGVELSRRTALC